jgi:prepilin-type processing-associated H-X9-DG protein
VAAYDAGGVGKYSDFSDIGWFHDMESKNVVQRSNHLTAGKLLAGANQLYLDGHVEWYPVAKFTAAGLPAPVFSTAIGTPAWYYFGGSGGAGASPQFYLWTQY